MLDYYNHFITYCNEINDSGWNWGTIWAGVSAIATFGATIVGTIAGYYAYKNFKLLQAQINDIKEKEIKKEQRIKNKINILRTFYTLLDEENIILKDYYYIILVNSTKEINTDTIKLTQYEFRFYKYKNIFECLVDKSEINGNIIPKGYNFYEILDKNTISLKIIDDTSGDEKNVYIYLTNASKLIVDHKNKESSKDKFHKITSWKNK